MEVRKPHAAMHGRQDEYRPAPFQIQNQRFGRVIDGRGPRVDVGQELHERVQEVGVLMEVFVVHLHHGRSFDLLSIDFHRGNQAIKQCRFPRIIIAAYKRHTNQHRENKAAHFKPSISGGTRSYRAPVKLNKTSDRSRQSLMVLLIYADPKAVIIRAPKAAPL